MYAGQSVTATVRRASPDTLALPADLEGATRRAFLTSDADTFFSQPARISYRNRKLRGFVTGNDNGGWDFIPFTSEVEKL